MHVTCAQTPQGKPVNVLCKAENYPERVVNAKTGKPEDRPNWTASCTIKQGDDVIWQERLVLPYPATKREAYDAIDEFQDKKAAEILRKRAEKNSPK